MVSSLPVIDINYLNSSSFIDVNQNIAGWDFTLGQFLISIALLIAGLIIAIKIPSWITKKRGYQNLIGLLIFIAFGFVFFFSLGFDIFTTFDAKGYDFQLIQFIIFALVILIFSLFMETSLSPILRVILYFVIGKSVKRKELNTIHKNLRRPFYYVFVLIMIHSAILLAFPDAIELPFYGPYSAIITLLAIIIGVYFFTSLILAIFHVNYVLSCKMDPHTSVAFVNLIKVGGFLVIIIMLLINYPPNPDWVNSLAFVFAAIGFALAFGMQNTIANIMSGFALAADKPFEVGDRIRVGPEGRETWGDVIAIGINTTTIKTVEEDTVVVPNNQIASNEVWNYTKDSPIIALTFDLGISYGSNWRLSKKLVIEEAIKHPYVLSKPQPFVRIEAFEDFAQKLKVWVWIRNARDKDQIRSDLLEAIKDRFDAEGVEIPFPYRTVVFKTDLAKEKQLPVGVKFDNVRRYESKGRDYFEVGEGPLKGLPVSKVVHEEDVKVLTPVAGMHNARRLAEYSMSLARKINGNVTAIYIMKNGDEGKEVTGLKALRIFEQYGTKFNINVATKIEVGEIVDKIIETIENDHINLVVIGGGRKAVLGKTRESVANEIVERSTVPVVTMPSKLKWY